MKVFIDLFSGLGGASKAFDEDPAWTTIKIDNNPDLVPLNKGLHIMDISNTDEILRFLSNTLQTITEEQGLEKVVIWASPPCVQYSLANRERDPESFDNTLLNATIDILYHINPDYHIIENVKGAIEEFNDVLNGNWKQRIKAMFLWGHFPLIALRDHDALHGYSKLNTKGSRKLRPNYRAVIPYEVSLGLKDSIDNQTTLEDWYH